jgi:murein L,D-transpeptidase YcbB/YkuD
LGLAIGAYFYFKKKNEDAIKLANDVTPGQRPVKNITTNTGTNTPVDVTPMPKGSLPFKMGSHGKLVQLMQVMFGLTPDGIWGKATQAAFDKAGDKIKTIARAGKVADLDQIFAPNAGEKHFPLEVGKNNSASYVKCLQVIYDLKIDGVYGAATAKAAGQTKLEYKNYLYQVQEFLYA